MANFFIRRPIVAIVVLAVGVLLAAGLIYLRRGKAAAPAMAAG